MRALRSSFVLLAALLLLAGTAARADEKTVGAYTIHYIAVNSTFLQPDIAAQYGIERSKRQAFLNISVLRNEADGSTTPVVAALKGGRRNLLQQQSDIAFQEVREGEAIYYIGQFDFSNAELVRFAVSVQPEHTGPDHMLEWSTQLYSD